MPKSVSWRTTLHLVLLYHFWYCGKAGQSSIVMNEFHNKRKDSASWLDIMKVIVPAMHCKFTIIPLDSFKYIIWKWIILRHTSVSDLWPKSHHIPHKRSMYSKLYNKTLPQVIKRELSKWTTYFLILVSCLVITQVRPTWLFVWSYTTKWSHYYLNVSGIREAELASRVLINGWLRFSVTANQWFHSH